MKKAPTINPVIFRSYADAFSYVLLLMYCYLFINIKNPLASDFLLFDSGILIYYFHFAAPQPEQV